MSCVGFLSEEDSEKVRRYANENYVSLEKALWILYYDSEIEIRDMDYDIEGVNYANEEEN